MSAPAQRAAIDWLQTEPAFQGLASKISGMVELQALLNRAYPHGAVEVLSLEGDTLVVAAGHSAAAARLRQLAPSVVNAMQSRGVRVSQLRVRTRRGADGDPRRQPPAPRAPIPASALEALHTLRQEARSDSLRDALGALLRQHRRPS